VSRPYFDDISPPPCNAIVDCGATGLNVSDDTAALQACIDKCEAVFLPYGIYLVSDTLRLNSKSALIGEMLTNIYLAKGAAGFGDGAAPKPVLDTPDDAAATVRITDISLNAGQGNPGAVMLRWRAGGATAGCWDLNVNISFNILYGIHAVGSGAGVFSNIHIWGADHSWWDNGPMYEDRAIIGFLGESSASPLSPLTAFALISEHHHDNMIKLSGAANYDLVIAQTEPPAEANAKAVAPGVTPAVSSEERAARQAPTRSFLHSHAAYTSGALCSLLLDDTTHVAVTTGGAAAKKCYTHSKQRK
jgi:hypothetical protein